MGSFKSLFLFFALFSCWFGSSCNAYQFLVGGRDGWVLNPSESYSHWAQRLRFQVNDTLLFKYEKGSDSVLVVNKDDFDNCNQANPMMKMDGGDSVFKFDRSGPFFFISGKDDKCQKGQKLVIIVLAVRSPPAAAPPKGSPPESSPPANPPKSPAPVTEPPSPSTTPAMPPTASSPGSPPAPFPPEAESPAPSSATSNETSPPPPPGKSSSVGVAPSVLVLWFTALVGVAVGSF